MPLPANPLRWNLFTQSRPWMESLDGRFRIYPHEIVPGRVVGTKDTASYRLEDNGTQAGIFRLVTEAQFAAQDIVDAEAIR